MSESSVTFSIESDVNGKLKIKFDGASKKKLLERYVGTNELSPCSSLASLDITKDSEVLIPGVRRRAPSESSLSASDSITLFDNEDLINRSSTPLPREDDSLSDASFTSCVSRMSETSIVTNSSQETVTSKSYLNKEKKKEAVGFEINTRSKPVSYEATNKERYGGWPEGDWRTVMKKPQNAKPLAQTFVNVYKTPNYSNTPPIKNNSSGRAYSEYGSAKSRIPSLNPRPTYVSPNSNRNTGLVRINMPESYATVTSQSSSRSSHFSNSPKPTACPIALKLTIITDSEGRMKLHFLNNTSEEMWAIDGVIGSSEGIDVSKIQ